MPKNSLNSSADNLCKKVSVPHPILIYLFVSLIIGIESFILIKFAQVEKYFIGINIFAQLIFAVGWVSNIIFGFHKNKAAYIKKFGDGAYKKAFYRYFLPGFISNTFQIVHPLFTGGFVILKYKFFKIIGLGIAILALYIGYKAFSVLGLDRAAMLYTYFPEEDKLVDQKIYSFLRHPLYSMIIHFVFGFALINGTIEALIEAFITFAAVIAITKNEEKELINRFGDSYIEYMKKTPAYFPSAKFYH